MTLDFYDHLETVFIIERKFSFNWTGMTADQWRSRWMVSLKNYLEVINSIAWIILCGRTGKTRTVDEEDSLSHFLPINQDSSPKVSSHFYLSPELFIATTQTLNNFVYFFRQIVLHGPDRGLLQDQSRAAAAEDCLSALIELHGRLSFGVWMYSAGFVFISVRWSPEWNP